MASLGSPSGSGLSKIVQRGTDISTESKRILYILDNAIERAEFVGTLGELVKDSSSPLLNILTADEHFFVYNVCRKYECQESVVGDFLVGDILIKDDKLEDNLGTLPRTSSSEGKDIISIEGEAQDELHIKAAERLDSELSRVLVMLEGNEKVKQVANSLRDKTSPQMNYFISCLRELRHGIEMNLGESAAEAKIRDNYLRDCYTKNEQAKKEIAKLEEELVSQKANAKSCIIGKNILINRHKNKMEKMQTTSQDIIEKRIRESEKDMANDWKASQALQETLGQDAEAAQARFEDILKNHLATEKSLRIKRTKVENQLIAWLHKFDQDIGEKQAEEEEIQAEFDEEKKQLEDIQQKLDEQEEEYEELMQEKAEYEREVLEQKLYIFILNRSARRIQRSFRLFKARKAAKKKEKKKGKRGKKKSS